MTTPVYMNTLRASEDFRNFVRGYIVCALWSSTDDHGAPLDDNRDDDDLADDCRKEMEDDCADFMEAQWSDLHKYVNVIDTSAGDGGPWDYAGHDFWLTRNGHGAGFWDRGLGALGNRLSEAARVYSGVDLYVGDDGKIHC